MIVKWTLIMIGIERPSRKNTVVKESLELRWRIHSPAYELLFGKLQNCATKFVLFWLINHCLPYYYCCLLSLQNELLNIDPHPFGNVILSIEIKLNPSTGSTSHRTSVLLIAPVMAAGLVRTSMAGYDMNFHFKPAAAHQCHRRLLHHMLMSDLASWTSTMLFQLFHQRPNPLVLGSHKLSSDWPSKDAGFPTRIFAYLATLVCKPKMSKLRQNHS